MLQVQLQFLFCSSISHEQLTFQRTRALTQCSLCSIISQQTNSTLSKSSCGECTCCWFRSINKLMRPWHSACYRSLRCFLRYADCASPTMSSNYHSLHRSNFRLPCPNKMDHNLTKLLGFLFVDFLHPTSERYHLLRFRLDHSTNTWEFSLNPVL